MLKIENIEVSYDKVKALKGVSLEINESEFVAVIGSNGAGKTTMMNTISGLLRPSVGQILFKGQALQSIAPHKIVGMGIAHVPEGRKVFATQSVKDNLMLGAFLRLRKGEKQAVEAKMEEIFEVFPRLKERINQKAGTLSGGEQQMLALGRALISEPELLLLDEPSMGLAPVIVDEVFELLKRIKQQKIAVLLVEQFAYRALGVADRAYVLEQGRVTMEGNAKDLMSNPEIKKAYLGG